jgi:hypothetical protein
VIVHINHISQSKKPKGNQRSPQSELASLVTGSLMSLVEEGVLDARLAPSLRIHLDWIQYKTNFRDPVIVRRTTNPQGQILPLAEIAIDLRQADASRLPEELARAVQNIGAGPESNGYNHLYLDEFRPYRDCLIWPFNRLFWRHLGDWEAMSGKGFEASLPGGTSDANHPQAVLSRIAISCRRTSSVSRLASAQALVQQRGWIASRRSTRSAARTSIRASTSSSATTRRRASSGRSKPSPITASTQAGFPSTHSTPRSR